MSGRSERPAGAKPADRSPLRVCVVGPSLDIIGGQSIQAHLLLERLRGVPSLEMSFLAVNPRLPGILHRLQRIKYVRTIATSAAYIGALVRRVPAADVLHVFSASYWSFILAPVPAMLIGRLYGKRVILNYHSGEAEDHFHRWRRTAVPLAGLAHRIVVPSEYLVEVFARIGLRADAIGNFVEIDRIVFRARDVIGPVILSNRNFEPHYNVSAVLRAFALVQARFPDARLTVAGDGSQRGHLRELARELALRNVEFTGPVPPQRMAVLYDSADIYLNASEIDNMPLSILEAYAAGLPVVTTAAGGIPYITKHQETGLLVERGDVAGLAAGVIRLLGDPALVRTLTTNARAECLERYAWRAVAGQWERCYRSLVGAPGGALVSARQTE